MRDTKYLYNSAISSLVKPVISAMSFLEKVDKKRNKHYDGVYVFTLKRI